jgi:ketopantoate reductase
MWLSGRIIKPGETVISHVQRGYPLKEIDNKMKKKTIFLRKLISKKVISPNIKNIYSEIYIKSINSFAFNLIALKTGFNNFQIGKSKKTIKLIKDIINEFEIIVKRLNIPIYQTINSRIKQTLSSKNHTMSMLNDYNTGRKVEIVNCWNNLNLLNKALNTKTKISEKTYNFVIKKIKHDQKNRIYF